jgi:uncharacterized protein with PQ loop repeat
MMIDVLGWVAAASGPLMFLPQVARLIRDKTSAGISLLMWQFILAAGISWFAHGVLVGRPNMWVTNGLSLASTLLILRMIRADRSLSLARVYAPGLLVAALAIATDVLAGPVVFGFAILAPLAIGALGQLRSLVLDADLSGVSMPFTVGGVFTQVLWFTWSIPAREVAVTICATTLMVTSTASLAWLVARRAQIVGPLGRRALAEDPCAGTALKAA